MNILKTTPYKLLTKLLKKAQQEPHTWAANQTPSHRHNIHGSRAPTNSIWKTKNRQNTSPGPTHNKKNTTPGTQGAEQTMPLLPKWSTPHHQTRHKRVSIPTHKNGKRQPIRSNTKRTPAHTTKYRRHTQRKYIQQPTTSTPTTCNNQNVAPPLPKLKHRGQHRIYVLIKATKPT